MFLRVTVLLLSSTILFSRFSIAQTMPPGRSLQSPASTALAQVSQERSPVSFVDLQAPLKARKAYNQAVEDYRARRLPQAEKSLDKALAIHPGYPAALTLRGLLLLNTRQVAEAEQQFQAAVRCDPRYHMAHIGLGAAYNAELRFDEAMRSAEQGLALAPTFWWGYYEMALAMVGMKQYEAALAVLSRAERTLPNEVSLLLLPKAGALAGLRNYAQASRELERYLEKEPTGPGANDARDLLARFKTLMAERDN
jgi:tetratricopeptide (TPR) repeat protein